MKCRKLILDKVRRSFVVPFYSHLSGRELRRIYIYRVFPAAGPPPPGRGGRHQQVRKTVHILQTFVTAFFCRLLNNEEKFSWRQVREEVLCQFSCVVVDMRHFTTLCQTLKDLLLQTSLFVLMGNRRFAAHGIVGQRTGERSEESRTGAKQRKESKAGQGEKHVAEVGQEVHTKKAWQKVGKVVEEVEQGAERGVRRRAGQGGAGRGPGLVTDRLGADKDYLLRLESVFLGEKSGRRGSSGGVARTVSHALQYLTTRQQFWQQIG